MNATCIIVNHPTRQGKRLNWLTEQERKLAGERACWSFLRGVVNSHDRFHCCNSILFISCRTKVVVGETRAEASLSARRARFVVGDMLSLRTISKAAPHQFSKPPACACGKKNNNPLHLQRVRQVNVGKRACATPFFFPPEISRVSRVISPG